MYEEKPTQPENERTEIVKPNTVNVLSKMIQSYIQQQHTQPYGMDRDPKAAAIQWVKLQDPPTKSETPELRDKREGGKYWHTPYLDRLKLNLNHFLSMKQQDQKIIVDAKLEHKLPWRGEPIDVFKHLLKLQTMVRGNET